MIRQKRQTGPPVVRPSKQNTTGSNNTANGAFALFNNTVGSSNMAIGDHAGFGITSGNSNICLGAGAGSNQTTGDNNIYIGDAGALGESNMIAIGARSDGYFIQIGGPYSSTLIGGDSSSTYIGGYNGYGYTEIGTNGETHIGYHGNIYIGEGFGNPYIYNVFGYPTFNGYRSSSNDYGRLGTSSSSQRFKKEIKPMDVASESILALKPVTFHYKKNLDPKAIPQFGLVAEQVEKVNRDLVARDEQGKAYSVRYEAVNAMLLNEFLKEHRKNEQQRKDFEAALAQQKRQIEALTATVKQQSEQIQKVSARLELSKATTQSALNN